MKYGTTLADAAGIKETEVTLADDECSISGLLRKLVASVPRSLAAELVDPRSGRPACLVTVNGRLVPPSTVTGTPLQDGDSVSLIAPMSGGASSGCAMRAAARGRRRASLPIRARPRAQVTGRY